MRIAILSDIHGNLDALESVLADVATVGADALYSLGDIVGYGPEPAGCVEVVRERADVSLLGNHDAFVGGGGSPGDFNEFARSALDWTAAHLDAGQRAYLAALPYVHRAPQLLLVHASPLEPSSWRYVHGLADIDVHFAAFGERLCFFGHTHRPGIFACEGPGRCVRCAQAETLRPGVRYLVNAGSVGQPRDRDPRSCYALFDESDGRVWLRRVSYPVAATLEKMRAARLPAFLADRLAAGV